MIGLHLDNARQAQLFTYLYIANLKQTKYTSTMNCLSKDIIQLLDLPDELIVAIMNKIQPRVLLLCSIIDIGNNRLEQLALNGFYSIDLNFNCFQLSHRLLFIGRFYSHVMPCISNCIQSLTLNIAHISGLITFAEQNCNGTLPNLTHLKITNGANIYSTFRRKPLFSIIPQLVRLDKSFGDDILSTICSSFMRSIVSFELDNDYVLTDVFNDDGLFFPQSLKLTHIRITLCRFEHCVRLLNQLGSQLCSFSVSITYVYVRDSNIFSEMTSISCPYLKQLTMTIYRNIIDYKGCIIPLLQRFSNVEYLTLLLAIGVPGQESHYFVNGFDLENDIVSYMPYLRQFNFHIRSILKNASNITIDTIRQSFMRQKQLSANCALDHFNNNYSQCQIYTLPFIRTRLDFISNRFPLFDTNNIFSMVTILLLFDDVKPFENVFFERLARALPCLKTLEIWNELKQQEEIKPMTNNLKFGHLATLILFDIHMDYAEQFLCRTNLPCLIELAIHKDILLAIIAQDQQQARDNCSRVETLRTSEPIYDSVDALLNFFPPDSYVKHPKEEPKENK